MSLPIDKRCSGQVDLLDGGTKLVVIYFAITYDEYSPTQAKVEIQRVIRPDVVFRNLETDVRKIITEYLGVNIKQIKFYGEC